MRFIETDISQNIKMGIGSITGRDEKSRSYTVDYLGVQGGLRPPCTPK
jgi:hypothetical protein